MVTAPGELADTLLTIVEKGQRMSMEFLVRFETFLPESMSQETVKALKTAERQRAMELRDRDFEKAVAGSRTTGNRWAVAGHFSH